jgi:membrane protease YdiL (CAAX protease family)
MLLQTLINTVIQIIVFSIIPFLWWLVSARKKERFLFWVGLKMPRYDNKLKVLVVSLSALVLLLLPGIYLVLSLDNRALLANAKFAGTGINGILPILLYAVIQTGLCEEIFFRGFLNKRISHKFGAVVGNITQAVLFGLLHGVLLFGSIDIIIVVAVIVFASIVGLLMGYLNEKLSDGSIVPSWIIHSLMNIISSSVFWLGIVAV